MTFENWMNAVDKAFQDITGLDRDSWPDQDYWSMWEEELTPREAVASTIENEYGQYGLEAFELEAV